MKNEIHPLKEIDWMVIPTTCYRGCLVHRLVGGYRVFDNVVITPEEVDEVMSLK